MQLYCDKKNKLLRVRLVGELDDHAANEVRDKLDSMIGDDVTDMHLDLSGLTFMDSSGIGVIIGRYKILSARGGAITVTKVNTQVDKLIRMAGLYSILKRV